MSTRSISPIVSGEGDTGPTGGYPRTSFSGIFADWLVPAYGISLLGKVLTCKNLI